MSPRFDVYVKASSIDGKGLGDCPFSQYVTMVIDLLGADARVIHINLEDKPKEFLELNPKGNVPVLVDTEKDDTVIADSQKIVEYLQNEFPGSNLNVDYDGPALSACSKVFMKLAGCLKNKDEALKDKHLNGLLEELNGVNSYLGSAECPGPFLLGDKMSAIDCSFLPKLAHLKVAGKRYLQFEIPSGLEALHNYMEVGMKSQPFYKTSCDDKEIISGWQKHVE